MIICHCGQARIPTPRLLVEALQRVNAGQSLGERLHGSVAIVVEHDEAAGHERG
jgi:hypothetical protein